MGKLKEYDCWNLWQKRHYTEKDGKFILPFMVEASHTEQKDGDHLWSVRVYVYKSHPWFDKIDTKGTANLYPFMDIDRGVDFSFSRYDDKGDEYEKVIACNYNHLHDDDYRTHAPKDFHPVFLDVDMLFEQYKEAYEHAGNERG